VPAFENVGGRAPQDATEIRIQGRSDQELARWMAQALAKSGAGEVRSRTLRKAQSGNDVFEIWLDQTLCMPDGKQAPSCAGSSGGH
jgi:hypothetical protein